MHDSCDPTLQGAGALLREAEVLLAQSLQRLVLSDLHARAHVAVAMHEEGERARKVLAEKVSQRRERLVCKPKHIEMKINLTYAPKDNVNPLGRLIITTISVLSITYR